MASSSSTASQALLNVEEGDRVDLEAEYYDWTDDFDVVEVDEVRWKCPTGGIWRSRTVRVESQNTRGQQACREIDVVQGAGAPVDEAYGRLIGAERVADGTAGDDDGDADGADDGDAPAADWLERPATEIVASSSVDADVAEVLSEVERQDSLLDVHRRLRVDRITNTKELLWELGLRQQGGQLLPDAELDERLAILWEVAADG